MVRKKKSPGIKVNFKGVEAGAKSLPDGTYTVVVESVEQKESDSGNDYLSWKYKVTSKEGKGRVIFDNTSLQPQALFRLRGLLEALGHEIDDDEVTLDLADFIGKSMVVEVVNEVYQGKKNPKIATYGSSDDSESDSDSDYDSEEETEEEEIEEDADEDTEDDEEEKPASKKKTSSKKKAADEDEDSDEEDEVEDEEDDEEEESEDEEEPSIKVKDKVKFVDDKGKIQKGKVVKIVKDHAMIDVSGKEWKVPLDELTVI